MLKLGGFERVVIILAAGLVAGIVHLYLPLLVSQAVKVGTFAGAMVLLLWLGQWVFIRLPRARKSRLGGTTQLEAPPGRPLKPRTIQPPEPKHNED